MAKMTDLNGHIQEMIKAGATLVVEDLEEHCGYTRISNVLLRNPEISEMDKTVYGLIRSFAYGDKINAFPGQDRLAQYLGKRRETVNTSLNRLKKHGLIDWIRRGMGETNIYVIKKIPQEMILKFIEREAQIENQQNDKKTLASIMQSRGKSNLKSTDVSLNTQPSKSLVKFTDVRLDTHQDVSLGAHLDVSLDAHKEYKINNKSINNQSFNHSVSENMRKQKEDGLNDDGLNLIYLEEVMKYAMAKLRSIVPEDNITELKVWWGFWADLYGVEAVKYAIDRLSEQQVKITSIAGWIKKALENPHEYPPRVGFQKKMSETNVPQEKEILKKKNLMRSMYS